MQYLPAFIKRPHALRYGTEPFNVDAIIQKSGFKPLSELQLQELTDRIKKYASSKGNELSLAALKETFQCGLFEILDGLMRVKNLRIINACLNELNSWSYRFNNAGRDSNVDLKYGYEYGNVPDLVMLGVRAAVDGQVWVFEQLLQRFNLPQLVKNDISSLIPSEFSLLKNMTSPSTEQCPIYLFYAAHHNQVDIIRLILNQLEKNHSLQSLSTQLHQAYALACSQNSSEAAQLLKKALIDSGFHSPLYPDLWSLKDAIETCKGDIARLIGDHYHQDHFELFLTMIEMEFDYLVNRGEENPRKPLVNQYLDLILLKQLRVSDSKERDLKRALKLVPIVGYQALAPILNYWTFKCFAIQDMCEKALKSNKLSPSLIHKILNHPHFDVDTVPALLKNNLNDFFIDDTGPFYTAKINKLKTTAHLLSHKTVREALWDEVDELKDFNNLHFLRYYAISYGYVDLFKDIELRLEQEYDLHPGYPYSTYMNNGFMTFHNLSVMELMLENESIEFSPSQLEHCLIKMLQLDSHQGKGATLDLILSRCESLEQCKDEFLKIIIEFDNVAVFNDFSGRFKDYNLETFFKDYSRHILNAHSYKLLGYCLEKLKDVDIQSLVNSALSSYIDDVLDPVRLSPEAMNVALGLKDHCLTEDRLKLFLELFKHRGQYQFLEQCISGERTLSHNHIDYNDDKDLEILKHLKSTIEDQRLELFTGVDSLKKSFSRKGLLLPNELLTNMLEHQNQLSESYFDKSKPYSHSLMSFYSKTVAENESHERLKQTLRVSDDNPRPLKRVKLDEAQTQTIDAAMDIDENNEVNATLQSSLNL